MPRKTLFALSMLILITTTSTSFLSSSYILIPMDFTQTNHLKAYGVAYKAVQEGLEVYWLLYYRGGSFVITYTNSIASWAASRGVLFEKITASQFARIQSSFSSKNMAAIRIVKAPKLAVLVAPYYEPWDDAVKQVLEYAEIPFDKIWYSDLFTDKIFKYDWLYLHHEDFTGQFGRFYISFANTIWYQDRVKKLTELAQRLHFKSVAQMLAVAASRIREFIKRGGFLFAMCSATDTLDIALATDNGKIDIVPAVVDRTPIDPDWRTKLDYSRCLAFQNFKIVTDPNIYEFSDIDYFHPRTLIPQGYFDLYEFSAKYDRIPSILVQCHVNRIPQFLGQTTDFNPKLIKPNIVVLAKTDRGAVKYLYGTLGSGSFTMLGGHDPEDYAHIVGEKAPNMDTLRNSPGYRLILNNVLLPAVKKVKRKT